MSNEYLRTLASLYRKFQEERKKEGSILSYKIFMGTAANKDDWDIMTLTEYKNVAALDGMEEKAYALVTKLLGPEEKLKDAVVKRSEIREVLGEKLVRELILK